MFLFSGMTDFIPLQTTLTASSAGSQTVSIQLTNDNVLEDQESFTVQLYSTDPRVSFQQDRATVFINDDDSKKLIMQLLIMTLQKC